MSPNCLINSIWNLRRDKQQEQCAQMFDKKIIPISPKGTQKSRDRLFHIKMPFYQIYLNSH